MATWNGSTKPSFGHLPIEILMKTLNYLKTDELLACRRVSKLWLEVSSTLNRKRGVICRLESMVRGEGPGSILNRFKNVEHLPWSTIHLRLYRPYVTHSMRISQNLGHYLKRLTISVSACNYNNIVKVIGFTPNLQHLNIDGTFTSCRIAAKPLPPLVLPKASSSPNLPKLQALEVSFTANCISTELLEYMLRRGPGHGQLTSLILKLNCVNVDQGLFQWLVIVLLKAKVKEMSLEVVYTGSSTAWKLLGSSLHKKLKTLLVSSYGAIQHEHFQSLQNLLANSKELTSLKLVKFYAEHELLQVPVERLLYVPKLPNLQTLEIFFEGGHPSNAAPNAGHSFIHFHPLFAENFPCLEKVILHCDYRDESSVDISKLFDTKLKFDTVKFLEVECYSGGEAGSWISVFPNLVDVSVTIKDSKDMIDIFRNIQNLEEVSLTLLPYYDVDWVIFEAFEKLSSFNIAGLKKLTVNNRKSHCVLRDQGAVLFSLLPPLHLVISETKTVLSEHCISQLASRHVTFEHIYDDRM